MFLYLVAVHISFSYALDSQSKSFRKSWQKKSLSKVRGRKEDRTEERRRDLL